MPHSHDTPIHWADEEEHLIARYYGKLSYEGIAKMLPGRTWMAVRHRANAMGLTSSSNLGRRYSANTSFFSVPTSLNAYWAGFIAADGCVRGNRLSVTTSLKDEGHMARLAEAMQYTGPIYHRTSTEVFQIACQQMVDDLRLHFNIIERKSTILEPPHISNETLVQAFIVGLIDGDGSIGLKRYKQYEHLRIVIYGTQAILEWVRGHFDRWAGESQRPSSQVHSMMDGRRLYGYKVSASRAVSVGRVLLGVDVPRLARKWGLARHLTG